MPLSKGKKSIGKNIKTLVDEKYPRKQAIAIAMDKANMSKDKKVKKK
jgi:hypothetical protein